METLLIFLSLAQLGLGIRVLARWAAGMRGVRITESNTPLDERVSIIIPVLNEADRIESCLASCARQTEEVLEILVVDGGSTDNTPEIVSDLAISDSRIRLLNASPVPSTWTGKAWGLNMGLHQSSPASQWVLCLDADVRAGPNLTRSLLAHASRITVSAFSVATQQQLADVVDAALHPAMLTTLIYRFGLPGRAVKRPSQVQANGQCFFCRRELLQRTQAIDGAQASLCEDITIVRGLCRHGVSVGFYEAQQGLVSAAMYNEWRQTWHNWTRSLPMRDRYFGWRESVGLLEIVLLQALCLPLLALTLLFALPASFVASTGVWALLRVAVLVGSQRVYPDKPWSYWLSPLLDLPVVAKILRSAVRRRHSWRGRHYLRVKGGGFQVVEGRPSPLHAKSLPISPPSR